MTNEEQTYSWKRETQVEMADWLSKWQWNWILHLTFGTPVNLRSATWRIKQWLKGIAARVANPLGYYINPEQPHSHDRPHAHGVLAGVGDAAPKDAAKLWRKRNGIVRIETFDPERGGLRYVTKNAVDGEFLLSVEGIPCNDDTYSKSEQRCPELVDAA